ncbi:MAG: carotenoid oxygenase family protein [Mycobacterium sp.]|nr:carotenoid oxygenase family protein [Mycobacterium sp.]
MASRSAETTLPDVPGLPALGDYLDSLDPAERSRAIERMSTMGDADLRSLGVSEPQHTEFDYDVDGIDGEIPAELSGTLYRNGPGRWQDHTGRPLHHLFDGDGMISAFQIGKGGVRYRNRYVRTQHYRAKSGTRHMGTDAVGGFLANIGRLPTNLANTNVVEHAGHLYALWEGGPPYEVDPETLETRGLRRFGGELRWIGSYSAHPCLCPSSGDMFNFGVEFIPNPHLRVYRTDRDGRLQHYRSVSLPYVAMVHDFAITERYLVFIVSPIIPDGIPIALGLKAFGDAMRYQPERGSSFILIPRDGGRIRRIEHDAIMQFHLSNAFDDRGDVVVDVITYDNGQLLDCIARFRTSPLDDATSQFTRFRLTASGRVICEQLSDRSCEFPRHHPDHEGRPHRYSYYNSRRRLGTMFDQITKLDLSDSSETHHAAETAGNSFCEPVFTPRPGATDEDDGWLLSVEYQADTHTSRLVILDAGDLEGGPIATAQLNHHVPQGFHGNFVSQRSSSA